MSRLPGRKLDLRKKEKSVERKEKSKGFGRKKRSDKGKKGKRNQKKKHGGSMGGVSRAKIHSGARGVRQITNDSKEEKGRETSIGKGGKTWDPCGWTSCGHGAEGEGRGDC